MLPNTDFPDQLDSFFTTIDDGVIIENPFSLSDFLHPTTHYDDRNSQGSPTTTRSSEFSDNSNLENMITLFLGNERNENEMSSFQSGEAQASTSKAAPIPDSSVVLKRKKVGGPPRRQYKSCDQCRAGKLACDLPVSVCDSDEAKRKKCASCSTRGTECTIEWVKEINQIRSKKKKRSESTTSKKEDDRSNSFTHTHNVLFSSSLKSSSLSPVIVEMDQLYSFAYPATPSIMEEHMCSSLISQAVEQDRCKSFYEVVEIPFFQWLSSGCLPRLYGSGIIATSLTLESSSNFQNMKPNPTIQKCSFMTMPHLLFAVQLLDTLISSKDFGNKRFFISNPSSEKIESALLATIITIGSQSSKPSETGQSSFANHEKQNQLYTSLWVKCKTKLFDLMPETRSFKLALSFMIFGCAAPPTVFPSSHLDDSENLRTNEEFARSSIFALSQGFTKMRYLCKYVRSVLRHSPCATFKKEQVVQLLAAFEWFIVILESTIMLTLRNIIQRPMVLSNEEEETQEESVSIYPSFYGEEGDGEEEVDNDDLETQILEPGFLDFGDSLDGIKSEERSSQQNESVSIENFCLSTSKKVESIEIQEVRIWNSVIKDCRQDQEINTAPLDSAESIESLLLSIRKASSLKVLLWRSVRQFDTITKKAKFYKSLARRNIVSIEQDHTYQIILKIIRLWHTTYSSMATRVICLFAKMNRSIRSMISFVCLHIPLATLHFCDIAQSAQQTLVGGKTDYNYFLSDTHEQLRVDAAKQVALITEANLSPDQRTSFKITQWDPKLPGSSLEQFYPDFLQHPCIGMLAQSQHMAAHELLRAAEMAKAKQDWENVASFIRFADICMRCIQKMSLQMNAKPIYFVKEKMSLSSLQNLKIEILA